MALLPDTSPIIIAPELPDPIFSDSPPRSGSGGEEEAGFLLPTAKKKSTRKPPWKPNKDQLFILEHYLTSGASQGRQSVVSVASGNREPKSKLLMDLQRFGDVTIHQVNNFLKKRKSEMRTMPLKVNHQTCNPP